MSETIDAAIAIIREEEGFRAAPYRCSEGVWTIGYGTVIDWPDMAVALDTMEPTGDTPPTLTVTRELAAVALRRRVERAHNLLRDHQPWYSKQDPERQAVLLSMAYQLGHAGLLGFRRMIAALEKGHHTVAAFEMLDSRWAKQTPARAERQAEAMRTGDISCWAKQ